MCVTILEYAKVIHHAPSNFEWGAENTHFPCAMTKKNNITNKLKTAYLTEFPLMRSRFSEAADRTHRR